MNKAIRFNDIENVTMSVDEWIDVEDNDIQRDTVKHSRKAVKYHLKELKLTHLKCAMAITKKGERIKLDAHTRSYMWEHNLLERPDKLFVDVYHVKDRAETRELYKHFDSSMSLESVNDKLAGAFKHLGIDPQSKLLKNGGVTTAVKAIGTRKIAWNFLDMVDVIKPFKKELILIDAENFSAMGFPAPALAAMIITVKMHGKPALIFWDSFVRDEGTKTAKSKDGIYCASEILRVARENGLLSGGSASANRILVPKLVWCFEKWLNKQRITSYPNSFPSFQETIENAGIKQIEPVKKAK